MNMYRKLNILNLAVTSLLVTSLSHTALAQTLEEPNLYELATRDGRLQVTFNRSSLAGEPQVHIRQNQTSHNFEGDQIHFDFTAMGELVTVTLRQIPDLMTVTASLLVPAVNVADGPEVIQTRMIFTAHFTTIAGPALVDGQAQVYGMRTLEGMASSVAF